MNTPYIRNIFKRRALLLQAGAWLVLIVVPLLVNQLDKEDTLLTFSWCFVLIPLLYIAIFYFNVLVLFNKFYLKRKYLSYGLSVAAILMVVLFIKPFDQLQNPMFNPKFRKLEQERIDRERLSSSKASMGMRKMGEKHHFDILSLYVFMMVVGTGTAYCAIGEWQLNEKRANKAEADQAQAEVDRAISELSFLKAQINPHFLYNMLNNIYALSVKGSILTPAIILRLSRMMRYVTDECNATYVPLEAEMAFVDDFVELHSLRMGKKVELNYQVTGDASEKEIAPLILMTYIENAFKYGLSNHEEAPVDLLIEIGNDQIALHTKNKIFDRKQTDKRSGVGMANTKRRLDYLYSNKHELRIRKDKDFFEVDLILYF